MTVFSPTYERFCVQVCGRGSQERMFFLFSDILIYAKKNGSTDKEQR